MSILSVYTLLKVVGYYDLSVLSTSVMGFQKKIGWGGWVGGVSSIHFFWNFLTLGHSACPSRTLDLSRTNSSIEYSDA